MMLTVRPETRYARSGDVSIAYQVLGDGPFDLVFAPGFVSNVEFGWEEPTLERFYRRLASFCRLIIFDKRGTGLSDRVSGVPDLETRMDDVRAIMDAVGSERAAVLGYSEGAAMAALFAATYPERAPALVLYGTFLTWDWLPEKRETYRQVSREQQLEEVARRWGTPEYCDELLRDDAPSKADDEDFRRWYATRLRLGASPAAAVTLTRMAMETDARPILPSIHVPTLIMHRVRGREMDAAGDGFFASFDGPARAIRCAGAIIDGVRELQLDVRAGLHTGECELIDGKVAGIAVHTGARISSLAAPGEVLVSSTVKDLVAGSGMAFQEHGLHELKGIPGEWRLYAVASGGTS